MKEIANETILNVLKNYSNENQGIKSNLLNLFSHGLIGNSGFLLILPLDQGMEHGPDQSFIKNPAAYSPQYNAMLAIKSGISAFAGPLGVLESLDDDCLSIPKILKINSFPNGIYSSYTPYEHKQSIIGSIEDALRLGCCGIGITIYPGSEYCDTMLEKAADIISKAKKYGLISFVWSYPRGIGIMKGYESAIDTTSYAIQIASMIGAHVIKVKIPDEKIMDQNLLTYYKMEEASVDRRIKHVMKAAFDSKRIVIFSGGKIKNSNDLYDECKSIKYGGGYGSIIGRNVFQRNETEAINILKEIIKIYKE